MDEYNELNEVVRGFISEMADGFDEGLNMVTFKNALEKKIWECIKFRKKCHRISLLVTIICGMIIYFHIWG